MDDTEVNGIGGIIYPKGIDTVVLDLEDNTGKIQKLTLKQVYYFLWSSQDPHQSSKMIPGQRTR